MSVFYATTPIYYVNAHPHLGHAYTTIVTDAFTRFESCMGRESMFITGTDEHGDKIVQAAEKAGQSVTDFTAEISNEFRIMWPKLQVEPARFIRTTSPEHKKVVQGILQRVYDKGDIYYGEYGGHYCLGCERFYTEKELENGLCPQHLTKPEYISEKNYFFKMSAYQDWLKQYILDNPDFIRPERYRSEALAMLEGGVLDDLCISRPKSRLEWGIELPFDANYVCYVWFDALLTYITALGGYESAEFEKFWPDAQHIIAKDILKPHAIFWPTMLASAGLPMFRHLNVHGYWLVRDTKMSKSIGNVIKPLEMADRYGLDSFRYFLLRDMHFGNDASFSEESLIGRLNADLANDLGNLFSRVMTMTAKFSQGKAPVPGKDTELEATLHDLAATCFENYTRLFELTRFSMALEGLWELIRALNKYVDTAAPWALAKANDTERLQTVLYTLLEYMRKIAIFLWPVMPGKAEEMLALLGQAPAGGQGASFSFSAERQQFGRLVPGTAIAPASNLFPRIEPKIDGDGLKQEEQGSKKMAAVEKQANQPEESVVNTITYDDFKKVELLAGKVLDCEKHPNADKILKLSIDLGEAEPRQVLSGLAEFFAPQDLVGRMVVVVANLAPRKIRGLESRGMVLTVAWENTLDLATVPEGTPPGTRLW